MSASRRTFMLGVASAVAGGTLLSSCSEDVPQVTTPTATPTPEPVIDSESLAEVLERIQGGLDAADEARDADELKGYLTGPALRSRKDSYKVIKLTKDKSDLPAVNTTSQAEAVALTNDFPRSVLAITESTDDSTAPLLLALTQEAARDPYQMWAWVRLFGGVEVPSTATPEVGAEQIVADSEGLIATPQEVLDAYVDALNSPTGKNGKAFADDALRQRVAQERKIDLGDYGKVSCKATAGEDGFQGLRTADGGALVLSSLSLKTVFRLTVAEVEITLGDKLASLLDDDATLLGTITEKYDLMVAFAIPAEGSDEKVATVLGAEMVIAGASRNDDDAPEADEDE